MSAAVSLWPTPPGPRSQHSSSPRHTSPSGNSDPSTAYHKPSLLATAAATGNPEQPAEIASLLSSGASVHQQDTKGNNCLHHLLSSAHPNQHWTALSLTTLLRAGADPSNADNAGRTSFDIACDAPPTYGSFRRDLLLQALLESDGEISDSRLFAPTRLTDIYTQTSHEILFNDPSPHAEAELRAELLERITEAMEQRGTLTDSKLHSAALTRTLSSYTLGTFVDRETIFNDTLRYMDMMCRGKSEIVRLCKARFSKIASVQLGESLNLLQMAQSANTSALLEFDWWRPVDVEDLFSTYVDFLIERLETIRDENRETASDVAGLVDMLQNAVPSYQTCTLRGRQCSPRSVQAEERPPDSGKEFLTVPRARESGGAQHEGYGSYRDWLSCLDVQDRAEEDKARKESIVATPVEFYAKKPW